MRYRLLSVILFLSLSLLYGQDEISVYAIGNETTQNPPDLLQISNNYRTGIISFMWENGKGFDGNVLDLALAGDCYSGNKFELATIQQNLTVFQLFGEQKWLAGNISETQNPNACITSSFFKSSDNSVTRTHTKVIPLSFLDTYMSDKRAARGLLQNYEGELYAFLKSASTTGSLNQYISQDQMQGATFTTPEFGSLAEMIIAVSIISTIVISQRFKFT